MITEKRDHRDASGTIPEASYFEAQLEFDVGSWSPEPPGTPNVKATQVHLRFGTPPGNCFLIRFKSAKAIDALIAALVEHRTYTFGAP